MSDKIREALAGLLAIVDESRGVEGYHLNGDIAEWDEFPEVEAARAALAQQPAPVAVPDGLVLLTAEQIARHALTAEECAPQSKVLLVSSIKRLHDKNAPPTAEQPDTVPVPRELLDLNAYALHGSGWFVLNRKLRDLLAGGDA